MVGSYHRALNRMLRLGPYLNEDTPKKMNQSNGGYDCCDHFFKDQTMQLQSSHPTSKDAYIKDFGHGGH